MSDLQLRQHVLDELEYEPRVSAAHVGVAVDGGVVTLTGHVSSYHEKLAVVAAVRRVKDVRAIADELEVRYPADKKTSDDEIAKRAIDILAWDTLVPSGAVGVMVRNGYVTLSGRVDWQYQKKSAEDDVHKLSGVRAVINNIEIKPHARTSDVARKIEDALIRRGQIEAKAIRVTVDNDKVVLEGKVDNLDQLHAIEHAAWSVPGVKSVEARIVIE